MKNRETYTEYIGIRGEPPELKHLSRERKRNQTRLCEQWRAKVQEAKPGVVIRPGLRTAYRISMLAELLGKANETR